MSYKIEITKENIDKILAHYPELELERVEFYDIKEFESKVSEIINELLEGEL